MKKLSVLFAAVLMMVTFGAAKAQKIATLDVASVLSAMPEKKKADEQLQAYYNSKNAELEKQKQAAQAKADQYQKEAPNQKPEVNNQRMAEIQKLQDNLQQMAVAAQKDMQTKQDEAYAPIERKFQAAVDKAAAANGWDYVLDSNNPVFIHKSGPDATAAVKKELGL